MHSLAGIFPVIPTLFTASGEVDPASTRRVTRFALDAGAHGIVYPGVASEVGHLSLEERETLVSAVAAEVDGQVPLIGGASAPSAAAVVQAGKQAMAYGCKHLMVMAPARLQQDPDAHRSFFTEVTTGLRGAEIILQNAPPPTGAGLDASALASIVQGLPAITYVKEETLPSGPVISALRSAQIAHLKGVLGGGGARYIIDELNRGALGALPAVELTDLHVALYKAHQQGDASAARTLYRASLPLLTAQAVYRMRLTKFVLKLRGIADNPLVRAPLPELDALAQQDVTEMVHELEHVLS